MTATLPWTDADPIESRGVTVAIAARALGICADTIRVWFDEGHLDGHRTAAGHRRIYMPGELDDEYLTISAAARLMGISVETVRRRFDEGRLRGFRLPSGQRRIARSSAARYGGTTT